MKEEIRGDINVYSLGLNGDIYVYITNQFEVGNLEAPKTSNGKPNPNPPHPNPKALLRSTTPS